jgi:hypothetical protein
MTELQVPLLDINPEGTLQRLINDIREELDIMLHINRTHLSVINRFVDSVKVILDPYGHAGGSDTQPLNPDSEQELNPYRWFEVNAAELRAKMASRIGELEQLQQSAQSVSNSVSLSMTKFVSI